MWRGVITALSLSVFAVACGSTSPTVASPASSTTPRSSTVSGTVFEVTADGRRAIPDASIDYVIDYLTSEHIGVAVPTDAQGHYTIPNVPIGAHLALFEAHLPPLPSGSFSQPCPAVAMVAADTVLDIEVVRDGHYTHIPKSPTLSGTVFYRAQDGLRQPYRAGVNFYSNGFAGGRVNLVRTASDSDGRFELCSLPSGLGVVTVQIGDTFDVTRKDVRIDGDTAVEIEVPAPSAAPATMR